MLKNVLTNVTTTVDLSKKRLAGLMRSPLRDFDIIRGGNRALTKFSDFLTQVSATYGY